MAPRSYIALALAAGPNRSAAVVTLAVALAVFALGRVPLPVGSGVDLRAPDRVDGRVQATPLGFSPPAPGGRYLESGHGRLIWNRPLPARFTLALDVAADTPGTRVVVSLGGDATPLPIARGPVQVELYNPAGLREIRRSTRPAGARVAFRRAAVR